MIRFFSVVVVVCPLGLGQPVPAPERLPIKRVVLYKNGVGYFEHVGPVRDKQEVAVSFTSGQLNDVLKSLTVLDLSGGRISGVSYDSSAPADRQFRDLRLPVGRRTSLTEFLEALRGARIEIKSGGTAITGRLLSVERKAHAAGATNVDVDYVSLVTETGEVRTTELLPSFSIRLLERGLPGKVDRYLDLAASPRDADVRRMLVSTDGAGERSLFLSYISEVPVWKSTYRIVLGKKDTLLQGWAIVDNTVGQDWDNVQLSLVAGAPQSFVQNLSQPFYARRPEIPIQASLMSRPQTFQATLLPAVEEAAKVGTSAETVTVNAEAPRLDTSAASQGGRSLGRGAQLGGNMTGPAYPMLSLPATRGEIGAARSNIQAAATGGELGDLFEYKLKQPITIERNRSALVPIVQSSITAEKVSVWNDSASPSRVQRSLWLTNSSGLTLDGGSFSVLEEETFAGEGIFDAIRPGEKRLVAYAVDLPLTASSRTESEKQRVVHVRIAKGVLTQESEVREKKTYTFRNEDASPRSVIIEHPVRPGYELRGDVKPAETTASWYRFRLAVNSKETAILTVEEARKLESTIEISELTRDRLALLLVTPALDSALRAVVDRRMAIDALKTQRNHLEEESDKIFDDQQRLRENLKALTGGAEEKTLVQRYTGQLDQQETRLEAIRKESQDLEKQIDAAEEELEKSIQALSFD